MLLSLKLENVGPAPSMDLALAPRLNLLTGDNGLGKSFLLDVAWWALTRRWPRELNPRLTSGYPARPTNPKEPAHIALEVTGAKGRVSYKSTYRREDQAWVGPPGRPWNPGLVLYAHADGGFAVWDPARNYWQKKGNLDVQERLPGYVFSAQELWHGLTMDLDGQPTRVCNGLIADWAGWIRERGPDSEAMKEVLLTLAPGGESVEPGPLVRISVDDARDIPSIRTPYAEAIPIVHASAGLKRVVALAYMLRWSWIEHIHASIVLDQPPASQVVLLFDEIESHLHPRWQRTILSSLLEVAGSLHWGAPLQLIAATHSPLILASAEPLFDAQQDAWFDLDLDQGKVALQKRSFVPRGEVSSWLTSEAFDLKRARSIEAELAIEQALGLLRSARPSLQDVRAADAALRRARLPDLDPFWVRWSQFVEDQERRPVRPTKSQSALAQKTQRPARSRAGKRGR